MLRPDVIVNLPNDRKVIVDSKVSLNDYVAFVNEENELVRLSDEGVYLCLRLKDTAKIGDTIEFSPYGSEETYRVKVAGYLRSVMSEAIIMTNTYADSQGIEYHIGAIFTDMESADIAESSVMSGKQDKDMIMDTYDTFMEIMNLMVGLFVVAAVVLGITEAVRVMATQPTDSP